MRTKTLAATLIALALATSASAGLSLKPQSKLWIEGDSTLHRWSSTSTALSLQAQTPSGDVAKAIRDGLVKDFKVVVPVTSLQSGEKGLDKNMQKALKAEMNPDITFAMTGYKISSDAAAPQIVASGALSIAGAKQDVTIEGPYQMKDGVIVIDGQYPLLMTDFGVKPPTLMLGAIKVDNHVTVKFHLELTGDDLKKDATGK